MYLKDKIIDGLKNGQFDTRICEVYGLEGSPEKLEDHKERLIEIINAFSETFPDNQSEEIGIFTAPGRTEIGGNHTDHQLGSVLAGSVDYDVIAAAAPNDKDIIRLYSKGYGTTEINLDELEPVEEEKGTTAALVRGMAAEIKKLGHDIQGFDAYSVSNVPGGSGISSSAAFEVLIGNIINSLSANEELDAVEIAKLGQKTENDYFGKPSGLMDQTASSVGGIISIDFKDKENPEINKVDVDFNDFDHVLCIIDTKSSHADLTDDYAGITEEMREIADAFGAEVLSQVDQAQFLEKIPELRENEAISDRAVLRALHYFNDTKRAKDEAKALEEGDFNEFLRLVNESGESSALCLQNIWSLSAPEEQGVSLALALSKMGLAGQGATRVHGGGFGGTIQAFVPKEILDSYVDTIASVLGEDAVMVMNIRPIGGTELI